ETDRVAIVKRIAVRLRYVIATIGVDPPDVVDHFVDQPRLIGCNHEFAKKWFGQPTRVARRRTRGNRIPLDTFLQVLHALRELRLKLGCEFGGGRTVRRLIGVESKTGNRGSRVDAGPVRNCGSGDLVATVGLITQRAEEIRGGLVLSPEFDHL